MAREAGAGQTCLLGEFNAKYQSRVFDSAPKALDGQHELWNVDGGPYADGKAVLHRDSDRQLWVDTDQTDPPLATAVGANIGAPLGPWRDPPPTPAGASIGAATWRRCWAYCECRPLPR